MRNKYLLLLEKLLLLTAGCISNAVYFVLKYVMKYRLTVITGNLKKAFPGKSEAELKKLIAGYYRHMSDLCVEPVLFYIAPSSIRKNLMEFEGIDLLNQLHSDGRNIVMLASHYGNWEYLIDLPVYTNYNVSTGYSPVKSKSLDRLLFRLRSRSGVDLIRKHLFYRRSLELLKKKDTLNMVVVIGDQRPAPDSRKYHVPFLGMDTDVQIGAERIAVKAGAAVVLIESHKTGRFKYKYRFELITVNAAGSPPLTITAGYFARLESWIRHSPIPWLWSHDRWKGQSLNSGKSKSAALSLVLMQPVIG